MSEQFSFKCECGKSIRVQMLDAGTTKTCPECHSTVTVPNTLKLKELAGDKYPHLNAIDKIRKTLATGEPPFDGLCHACGVRDAEFQLLITLNVMVERHVSDAGYRPSITGGIAKRVYTEEQWQATSFPLLFCANCQIHAEAQRSSAMFRNLMTVLLSLAAIVGIVAYAILNKIAFSLYLVAVLCPFVYWLATRGIRFLNRGMDPVTTSWLSLIRWVPEAIRSEEEIQLSIGEWQKR